MKKLLKLGIVSLASLALLSGCGEQPQPTPGPEPTPTPEVIKVTSITLNKDKLDLFLNGSEFLRATVLPENAEDKTLEWSSSDDSIAMVAANGKVVGLAEGTATITVKSKAVPTVKAECVVTVKKQDTTVHVTNVTLNKHDENLYINENLQLTATVLPENATEKDVVFSSSNEAIAIVTADGKVVGLSAGDVTITAASKEKAEIKDECVVHVSKKDTTKHVIGLEVSPKAIELDLGGTTTASPVATLDPVDATDQGVIWTSSDPTKVSVDSSKGTIIALKVTEEGHPVTITATSHENAQISDTLEVTVKDTTDYNIHVDSVELQETATLDLNGDESLILVANVLPANAGNKKINWTTSDDSTVTLEPIGDTSCKITGLKKTEEGSPVTITATSDDNPTGALTHPSCAVTVVDSKIYVEDVQIFNSSSEEIEAIDINMNEFANVTAAVLPDDATDQGIVWALGEGASDYISLSTTEGGSQTIIAKNAPTTEPVIVYAISAENNEIAAELEVSVVDPTIYPTSVSVKLNDDEISSANIELNKSVSLTAKLLAADDKEPTNKDVVWSIQTSGGSEFINLSSTTDKTITILGKKLTTGAVTLRAAAASDANIYKDITISVIDPTDVDKFDDWIIPSNYQLYLARTNAGALNEVEGIYQNDNLATGQFYKYDAADIEKQTYKVGDQGEFVFNPSGVVKLASKGGAQSTIPNIDTVKKLFKYNISESKYEEVELSVYTTVRDNIYYTFKDVAVGNKFKLELKPGSQYYAPSVEPLEFEFSVIHGYNVDSLAKLSLFDNTQGDWSDYKKASGLGTTVAGGGLILHKDIQITADILPNSFIWTPADVDAYLAGSNDFSKWVSLLNKDVDLEYQITEDYAKQNLFYNSVRDCRSLFLRSTSTEDFSFEGNYFSIDYQQLKRIAYLSPSSGELETMEKGFNGDGSHTDLFGLNTYSGRPTSIHTVTLRNTQFVGNGGLGGDPITAKMAKGGLINFKVSDSEFNAENLIISKTFTGLFTQDYSEGQAFSSMNADRCTIFDSYSSSFYFFKAKRNKATNSWFAKAGGPLAILDEPLGNLASANASPSEFDCENCYLNNPVTGMEPWFVSHVGSGVLLQNFIISAGKVNPKNPQGCFYGNTAAEMIQDGVLSPVGVKTISGTIEDKQTGEISDVCNFIAIDVSCAEFATNVYAPLKGHVSIKNGSDNLMVDMNEAVKDPTYHVTPIIPTDVAPAIYKSSAGGLGHMSIATGLSMDMQSDSYHGNYVGMYIDPVLLDSMTKVPVLAGYNIGCVVGTYDLRLPM